MAGCRTTYVQRSRLPTSHCGVATSHRCTCARPLQPADPVEELVVRGRCRLTPNPEFRAGFKSASRRTSTNSLAVTCCLGCAWAYPHRIELPPLTRPIGITNQTFLLSVRTGCHVGSNVSTGVPCVDLLRGQNPGPLSLVRLQLLWIVRSGSERDRAWSMCGEDE